VPYLQTDVEAGQKAALNVELNPLRAQSETQQLQSQMQVQPYQTQADISKLQAQVKKEPYQTNYDIEKLKAQVGDIPLESQKFRQDVDASELKYKTEKTKFDETVKAIAEDKDAKKIVQELLKNPEVQALSKEDQMNKIVDSLNGAGLFDAGDRFVTQMSKTSKAALELSQTRSLKEDADLESVHKQIESLRLDPNLPGGSNLDNVINYINKNRLLPPDQIQSIKAELQNTINTKDPKKLQEVINHLGRVYDSYRGKKATTDAVKAETARIREEERAKREEKKLDALLAQSQAKREAGDEKSVQRIAIQGYTAADTRVKDYVVELDKETARLAAFPPAPKQTSLLGFDTTSKDPVEAERTEIKDRIKDLKLRISGAERARDVWKPDLPADIAKRFEAADKLERKEPDLPLPKSEPKPDPKDVDIPRATDQEDFNKKYESGKPVIGLDGKKYTKPQDKNITSKTDKPKVKPQGQEQGYDFPGKVSLEYVLKDLTTDPKYEDRDFIIYKGRYFVKDSSKKEGYREAPASNYYDPSKEPKKKVTN